jgi:hypothetical protein
MVLVVAGGIVAFVAWLGILWAGYSYFVAESMSTLEAALVVVLALPVYAFGVFGFAYGWEREDVDRARRLAFTLGIVGLAILFLAALGVVVIAALAGLAGGGRSRGSSGRGGSKSLSGGGRFDSDRWGGSSSGSGSGSGGSGGGGSFARSVGRAVGEIAGGVVEGAADDDDRGRRPRRRSYVEPGPAGPPGELLNCVRCGNLIPATAATCPICGHEYEV